MKREADPKPTKVCVLGLATGPSFSPHWSCLPFLKFTVLLTTICPAGTGSQVGLNNEAKKKWWNQQLIQSLLYNSQVFFPTVGITHRDWPLITNHNLAGPSFIQHSLKGLLRGELFNLTQHLSSRQLSLNPVCDRAGLSPATGRRTLASLSLCLPWKGCCRLHLLPSL